MTKEDIRVWIKRIKKDGGLCNKDGLQSKDLRRLKGGGAGCIVWESIEGWGLSRVCPASAIIRATARVIGPVKLGPCVGASSAGGSVRVPGRPSA